MPQRIPRPPSRTQRSPRERDARSQAVQRVAEQALLRGSLVRMQRTCGKKNCRCQKGPEAPGTVSGDPLGQPAEDDLYSPGPGGHRSPLGRDRPGGGRIAGCHFPSSAWRRSWPRRRKRWRANGRRNRHDGSFLCLCGEVVFVGVADGCAARRGVCVPSFRRQAVFASAFAMFATGRGSLHGLEPDLRIPARLRGLVGRGCPAATRSAASMPAWTASVAADAPGHRLPT